MTRLNDNPLEKVWYREPWPWILMAGPCMVIVAGVLTLWLALKSSDGLVADDYYRRGLAINQELSRSQVALQRHFHANIAFSDDARGVRVTLSGIGELPLALQLRLAHPTRAGMDELVTLRGVAPGLFEARLSAPVRGRRVLVLEDTAHTWRLSAETRDPAGTAVVLAAAER